MMNVIWQENGLDRFDFLCEVDFQDTVKPKTWLEALEKLKKNYVTDMVISALANVLNFKIVIVTVHGVSCCHYCIVLSQIYNILRKTCSKLVKCGSTTLLTFI